MINHKFNILLLFAALALTGCSEDIEDKVSSTDAVELTGINASIETGVKSRAASDVVYLEDRISRYQFVSGDQMTFTKIQRTENNINRFTYKDVAFNSNASGAWERDKQTGSSLEYPDVHPERIYWSDATSAHTFVGYSLPKDNSAFDWKKSACYYDKDGTQHQFETYYGAIGDPLNATEVIDYNPAEPATETITVSDGKEEKPLTFGYSQKLRDEDLLLTYDDMLTADNSVANIKFRHALSSVRVIVNISGFYGTANDAYSKVSNMILKNQPTLYRWKQQSATVDALLTSNENGTLQQTELWGSSAPAYNQRKDINLWNTKPDGEGQGAGKIFTFYGITVPQDADYFTAFSDYKNLEMSFMVTYPDPMKNDPVNKTISKAYTATLTNPVKFYPGKCTTIHISLNHKDETMTVGASYESWEFEDTPDEGSLKKKNTFLTKAPALANRAQAGVTIVGDSKATADDATWLYEEKNQDGTGTGHIYDIYGNDGSATSPYTISTANQLLSFAYEVQNGRNFEHQFIKLDADITLQKTSSLETNEDGSIKTAGLIQWIGIGDATHPFDGFFLGNNRHINNLYGKPFFNTVGVNAVINKLDFSNTVEVQGAGVIANINNGLICGCNVDGNVAQQSAISGPNGASYCGSFVGINNSFIVGCTHKGEVSGHGYVGGIVGGNFGTMIACYHVGLVKYASDDSADPDVNNKTDGHNLGGSTGYKADNSEVFSCYFNSYLIDHTPETTPGKVAYGLTTAQMQSNSFVNSTSTIHDVSGTYTPTRGDANWKDFAANFDKCYSLNKAMDIYMDWVKNLTGTESVETNCRTFTPEQVTFLKAHYVSSHGFTYTPGAYPKIQ